MGPRIFIRGNIRRRNLDIFSIYALQWGHEFSFVETAKCGICPQCKRISFNGATNFHSWKRAISRIELQPLQSASMGPRIFIRGNCLKYRHIANFERVIELGIFMKGLY